jgi:hypothetical protein
VFSPVVPEANHAILSAALKPSTPNKHAEMLAGMRQATRRVAPAAVPQRSMALSKGHPRNPGEGGGFFGLNPPRNQTDAQKFDTFHAGHKITHPLELQGGLNPAGPDFNASVWQERNARYTGGAVPLFATVDPDQIGSKEVGFCENMVNGRWIRGSKGQVEQIPDPLNGQPMLEVCEVTEEDLDTCVKSFLSCPKYGMHNPILNVHRYLEYGNITFKAAQMLAQPEVEHFFARLIQRVSPKSYGQAQGEVVVTRKFLENFTGDNVRMLARSFGVPGDHAGQFTNGHRYPYGRVAIIAPFNFPLEIPVLQLMGALYMGKYSCLSVCLPACLPALYVGIVCVCVCVCVCVSVR